MSAKSARTGRDQPVTKTWSFMLFGRIGLSGLVMGTLLCSCQPSPTPASALEIQTDSIYNSLAPSPELQRGYAIYRDYGCVLCHGANGAGGVKNINAQTGEEIPAMTYIAEGYTVKEFKQRVRKGVATVARLDSLGAVPPFAMPGWKTINDSQMENLRMYVWSLYPNDEEDDW